MANGDMQRQIDALIARVDTLQEKDADAVRYDYAKIMFEHIENQIGRVDAKASIFVAASAILVGVNFTLLKEYDLSDWRVSFPGGVSLLVSFLALLASLDATTPLGKWSPGTRTIRLPIWPSTRTATANEPNPHSAWFFHDIAAPFPAVDGVAERWKSEYEESKRIFNERAAGLTENALRVALFDQVWGKAYWAKIRFGLVRRASKCMIASLILVAISAAIALSVGTTKDQKAATTLQTAIGNDAQAIKQDVATLKTDLQAVKGQVGDTNNGLVKEISEIKSSLNTVRTQVGTQSSGLVYKADEISNIVESEDRGLLTTAKSMQLVLEQLSHNVDDLRERIKKLQDDKTKASSKSGNINGQN